MKLTKSLILSAVTLGFVLSTAVAFGQDATTAAKSRKLADAACGMAEKVDLNTASADDIAKAIPGVGPSTAAAIVAARPFADWAAYDQVKGVGPAKLEASKRCATIGGK